MKILSVQEAYVQKFKRQKKINGLQYHAAGHCVHIGKLSPGCYSCFVANPFRYNICLGKKCNLNCIYCTSNKKEKEPKDYFRNLKIKMLRNSKHPKYNPISISFTGGGGKSFILK